MLTANNLCRTINGSPLWQNVTFELQPGARVALRGPSGSGKTLLMRALAGLDTMDDGLIRYRETSIHDWNLPDYRRLVRYIPQDTSFISGSVQQNITRFFNFKVNKAIDPDKALIASFLDALGLDESFLGKSVDHLSGGEKQVTALLRALLLEPEILLLDEPTSNIDNDMVLRVEAFLNEWMKSNRNRCFLWTSHDTQQLKRMTNSSVMLGMEIANQ